LRTQDEFYTYANYRPDKAFQTLEFLVRDWPHYPEGTQVADGRDMMMRHLEQYMDPKRAEVTTSMDSLRDMFRDVDVWCLPHPSLSVERQSWDGDLEVVEPIFWRFLNGYMEKIFSPAELNVKTTLGTPITVDTFSNVLREFISAFQDAAPQAQTFAEAMETSTALLARESAMKALKQMLEEEVSMKAKALQPEDFEQVAASAASMAEEEFNSKALFGTEAGIRKFGADLKRDVSEEVQRYREENDRRLEAKLSGLTNISLAAVAAFGIDRVSDLTCDWWSGLCRDLSNDLSFAYTGVALFVILRVFNIVREQGQFSATVSIMELGKSMVKRVSTLSSPEGKPKSGTSSKA